MPTPSKKEELITFLGTIAYVKRFIPDCSDLISPLTLLTGSKVKIE